MEGGGGAYRRGSHIDRQSFADQICEENKSIPMICMLVGMILSYKNVF